MNRQFSQKEERPSKVCLVAWGRPSFLQSKNQTGPSLRSTHFVKALLRSGIDVLVAIYRHSADRLLPKGGIRKQRLDGEEILLLQIGRGDLEGDEVRNLIAREFRPGCLVGATAYASAIALQLDLDVPFWADIFGDVMAEAQAKAFSGGADTVDPVYRRTLLPLLRQADRFSAVSKCQADALIGQLGLVGRLNAATAGEALVTTVPCAAEFGPEQRHRQSSAPSPPDSSAGDVPGDAFVVVWSGSFNTWCNIETLFEGLDQAMRRNEKIHFIATGGAIAGHEEKTYRRFAGLAAGSSCSDQFHLAGWVEEAQFEIILGRADVGVLIEHELYERRLGSENRVAHWMVHGIPCITTGYSEMGRFLLDRGMAFGGALNAGQLAELLLELAERPPRLERAAQLCRQYSRDHLTYDATARSLVGWCLNPVRAGDRGQVGTAETQAYRLSPYAVFYPSLEGDGVLVTHALYGSKFLLSAELFPVLVRLLQEEQLGKPEEEYAGPLGAAIRALIEEKVLLPGGEFVKIPGNEFENRLNPIEHAFQRAVNEGSRAEKMEGKEPPLILKEFEGQPIIELRRWEKPPKEKSLLSCLEQRQSIRAFSEAPMPRSKLERFLTYTTRAHALCEVPEAGMVSIRNYPSGGARYPLEVYPLIVRVEGLEPGIYHYHPFFHRLALVNSDHAARNALMDEACSKLYACRGRPAVLFIITAVFARTCRFYREIPLHLILQEVGALTQTMYLAATDLDLAPCAIGAFPEAAVDEILGLDRRDESQVGLFALGVRLPVRSETADWTIRKVRLREGSPFATERDRSIEVEFSNGLKQILDIADFRVEEAPDRTLRCRVLRGRALVDFDTRGERSLTSLLERHPELCRTVLVRPERD